MHFVFSILDELVFMISRTFIQYPDECLIIYNVWHQQQETLRTFLPSVNVQPGFSARELLGII